ncbi:hypothetical protein [Tahibacter caeni]|uniref:hypothetical protein n=1 Tax=Tahibacter caeni TaxID=1453545 RepID=UPI00214997A6|nr:hypothetical protein [Tahibacter caeni]
MPIGSILLRCSLVGLAVIFSGATGAANLSCAATRDGYRCEVWPQGAAFRYEWQATGRTAIVGDTADLARRRVVCADHSTTIAVSVITPAGYVETATHRLPACAGAKHLDSAALAASL